VSTKEKILDTALALFNQDGATEVTTNHIAAALGISPGNLYYHYKNKEEIIRALFERIDRAWDELFTPPTDRAPTLKDLEGLLETNFALLWEYRFFYRDLMGLLRRDPQLQVSYRRQRQRGLEGTRELVAYFAESGVLIRLKPQEIDALARIAYMISDFWLPSLELGDEPITPERFGQGVALLRAVLEPRLAQSKSG
jgi:AcrR family transcriptional regulator